VRMVSATRISKIVGVSEEEIINKSLISFIEREIRLAEADIADIRERYNVISKEELYEAIKSKKIASHPAWEDYIVWKNKERYVEDLNRWDNAPDHPELHTFSKHFHNGSNKDVKESKLDEDCEKAIRDVLGFIRRKLVEYKWV
jgi:hypothetical protein